VIGKINSKSWECIPNLCTYSAISVSLKIEKCISIKWGKKLKINKIKIKFTWSTVFIIFLTVHILML
jgi:hypothetical protein